VSASPTRATETPSPGTHRLTFEFDGTTRSYLLHAPPGYQPDKRLPLVIALHYYPGTGDQLRQLTGFDAKADQDNVLVAYPDGHGMGFNALTCCGTQDDVGFLKALTGHLIETWRADPDRVYLTGISNGGDMSFRMAVEATGMFAAIGVVSGGFSGGPAAKPEYVPKKPVSVLTVIGGRDQHADTFQEGIRRWQDRLRCTATGSEARPTYTRTISRCADGSDVEVYLVPEMGHVWPGAPAGRMGAPNAGLSATDAVWSFFASRPRIG
jgi:poly(3-hydroxybutyrate) depolymerase